MTGAYITGGLYVALVLTAGFWRKRRKHPHRKPHGYSGRHRLVEAITDFTRRDAETVRWLIEMNEEQ